MRRRKKEHELVSEISRATQHRDERVVICSFLKRSRVVLGTKCVVSELAQRIEYHVCGIATSVFLMTRCSTCSYIEVQVHLKSRQLICALPFNLFIMHMTDAITLRL